MKEIIHHGNKFKYYIICTNCKCRFTCTEEDIQKWSDDKDFTNCPECHWHVIFKREKILELNKHLNKSKERNDVCA